MTVDGSDAMRTEWVVYKLDGRLAIVLKREERGIKVRFPLEGKELVFPKDQFKPFRPADYPVQISAGQREKIKAAGDTPKDEIEKVCNQCFTLKQVDQFNANQNRKDGSKIFRPTCSKCRIGVDGVKNHATRKDGSQPIKPPLGAFWKCPICEKEGIVGVTTKLVLDHDHLTGDARDYICDSCNTGLGRFRNGKSFLENAIAFLKKYE